MAGAMEGKWSAGVFPAKKRLVDVVGGERVGWVGWMGFPWGLGEVGFLEDHPS